MKKLLPAIMLILTILMTLTVASASAEQAAATVSAPADDPLVGAWKMPPSPFGDDFSSFVVLKEDGSFTNVTNLYDFGSSGPYTQTVTTNETFRWVRTGSAGLELHYSYLDDNGEFVTELTYNEKDDALYFGEILYAVRTLDFILVK